MRALMSPAIGGALMLLVTALGQERAINETNPTAVQEVASGKRKEANAAWWGFDPRNATKAMQEALCSGAKKVTVPDMGKPWVVRPA
jgi:hypothetical protein